MIKWLITVEIAYFDQCNGRRFDERAPKPCKENDSLFFLHQPDGNKAALNSLDLVKRWLSRLFAECAVQVVGIKLKNSLSCELLRFDALLFQGASDLDCEQFSMEISFTDNHASDRRD